MNRSFRPAWLAAVIAVALLALWAMRTRLIKSGGSLRLQRTVYSVITDPAHFAKVHFTGGVGILLATNPPTGPARIDAVLLGSPAHLAGLRDGDFILRVNGWATPGKPLSQIAEAIKGLPNTTVALTVQRGGSTNYEYVIRRCSWKTIDDRNQP